MSGLYGRLAAFLCAVFLMMATPLLAAETSKPVEAAAKAILVLDASGSMLGQIEGRSKIEIARDVIADLVSKIGPGVHLGLTAYGHRRKGDCTDIESLIPVGPIDAKALISTVNSLKPKGKTPLSEAVRQAATALNYTEEKATVILVTDGKETCGANSCAMGRALEKSGVDFTTHVIGFDVKKEERAGLQCLAEATGGLYLNAETAATLASSLGVLVKEVKKAEKPAITLIPVMKEGGKPLEETVRWTLTAMDGGAETVLMSSRPTLHLSSGRYRVEARYGSVTGRAEIEVDETQASERRVTLNGGYVRLTAIPKPGAPPFATADYWRIYPFDANGKRARNQLAGSNGNPVSFTLPAGKYVTRVTVGTGVAEAGFTVGADETTDLTVVVGVGKVKLTAIPKPGAPPFATADYWKIYPFDANGKRARNQLTGSNGNPVSFTLPAGKYVTRVTVGTGVAEAEFTVGADETTDLTVVVGVGWVKLTAVPKPGAPPFNTVDYWKIYPLGANGKRARNQLTGSNGNPVNFALPEGMYRLSAKIGGIWYDGGFSVEAGVGKAVEFVATGK